MRKEKLYTGQRVFCGDSQLETLGPLHKKKALWLPDRRLKTDSCKKTTDQQAKNCALGEKFKERFGTRWRK